VVRNPVSWRNRVSGGYRTAVGMDIKNILRLNKSLLGGNEKLTILFKFYNQSLPT